MVVVVVQCSLKRRGQVPCFPAEVHYRSCHLRGQTRDAKNCPPAHPIAENFRGSVCKIHIKILIKFWRGSGRPPLAGYWGTGAPPLVGYWDLLLNGATVGTRGPPASVLQERSRILTGGEQWGDQMREGEVRKSLGKTKTSTR